MKLYRRNFIGGIARAPEKYFSHPSEIVPVKGTIEYFGPPERGQTGQGAGDDGDERRPAAGPDASGGEK